MVVPVYTGLSNPFEPSLLVTVCWAMVLCPFPFDVLGDTQRTVRSGLAKVGETRKEGNGAVTIHQLINREDSDFNKLNDIATFFAREQGADEYSHLKCLARPNSSTSVSMVLLSALSTKANVQTSASMEFGMSMKDSHQQIKKMHLEI